MRGAEGPVSANCELWSATELRVSGALPVLVIWRVCVEDWPITTVLKLKLIAEREITGWLGAERGVTLAQPITSTAVINNDAAVAMLPMERKLETRENTPAANPLRFGNSKLLFQEQCLQPVPSTVVGQGLQSLHLYLGTGEKGAGGVWASVVGSV